jgi:hypothetical protein
MTGKSKQPAHSTALNLKLEFAGSGYLIEESDHDTTKIVCQHGHIYADGNRPVAAIDHATPAESKALRRCGTVVVDGDDGELSVRFELSRFRDVARILKPRQVGLALPAA